MTGALVLLAFLPWSGPALADQTISGTPTWQTVPDTTGMVGYTTTISGQQYFIQTTTDQGTGQTIMQGEYAILGNQYGYYWTDANGDNLFIVCDQTTGQPVSAYVEGLSQGSGTESYTQTVTQTIEAGLTVPPPVTMMLYYPAGGGGNMGPPGYAVDWLQQTTNGGLIQDTTENITVDPNDPYQNFGVWPVSNILQVAENVRLQGSLGYGTTDTTVQIPAGFNGYLWVPISSTGTGIPGWSTATVDSVIGADGNTYPVQLPGDTGIQAELYSAPLNISSSNSGLPEINPGANLVLVQPGFKDFYEFQPTLNSVVGQLQPVSTATDITTTYDVGLPTITGTSGFSTPMTITGTVPATQYGEDCGRNNCNWNAYEPVGYVTINLSNPTPLEIIGGGSFSFDANIPFQEYANNRNYTGMEWVSQLMTITATLPSNLTVAPNSTATVEASIVIPPAIQEEEYGWGSEYISYEIPDGTYSLPNFQNPAEYDANSCNKCTGRYSTLDGSVNLIALNGAAGYFWDGEWDSGGGLQVGDFWNGYGWGGYGSPQAGPTGSGYASTSFSLPMSF